MMLEEFAPAKVNLTLHVTGQRQDGYHLLDSLVMFASVGDSLSFAPADTLSLLIDGPEGLTIPTDGNSILSAARMLDPARGARIRLTKNLPVSSGIGGGTADAAAAYRGLRRLWELPETTPSRQAFTDVSKLGADVPVCLFSRTARMSGVGEKIEFLPRFPKLNTVMVNPRVEVSTPKVFGALALKNNPCMDDVPGSFASKEALVSWLRLQRNDMQDAAIAIAPPIADVLSEISAVKSCQLARMSGSGATCFGLFPNAQAAEDAASTIGKRHTDWWVRACTLGEGTAS